VYFAFNDAEFWASTVRQLHIPDESLLTTQKYLETDISADGKLPILQNQTFLQTESCPYFRTRHFSRRQAAHTSEPDTSADGKLPILQNRLKTSGHYMHHTI
jgi:hypothetical protein